MRHKLLPWRKGEAVMITCRTAEKDDINILMKIRLEMLRVVNDMPQDAPFSETLIESSRDYFLSGDQTTVLAFDGDEAVGCASVSYIRIMPTFSHPTGIRAHLMNVYTRHAYRRQGIACRMVTALIEEAVRKGVTEISLDATESGRPLYKKLGFIESTECMVRVLR